jgi:hypothetical protein
MQAAAARYPDSTTSPSIRKAATWSYVYQTGSLLWADCQCVCCYMFLRLASEQPLRLSGTLSVQRLRWLRVANAGPHHVDFKTKTSAFVEAV